jgi:hypothetical protein
MAKSGLNRSVSLPQPSIFGRIGTGLGEGLAQQLPKEIERNRLSGALQKLGDQKGLTPYQQFTGLVSAAHEYPQVVQSGSEILRQQGMGQGLRNNQGQPNQNPLRPAQPNQNIPQGQGNAPGLQPESKGLVKSENTQEALKNYIPKTREQLQERAADFYEQNPQLYPTPEMAMQAATQEDQQNQAISNAKQAERQSQIGVEDRLRGQLSDLRNSANAKIPDNVFQQVENDVIEKVSYGMPELEAAKKGQEKLDEISRQYSGIDRIGNWLAPSGNPSATRRSLESLQNDFKKRKDLENFADSLVGRNGLSYGKGYFLAYPPKDFPEVNKEINALPKKKTTNFEKGFPELIKNEKETLEFAKKIAPIIKKSGASPLSTAEAIRQRGYDPDTFLDYLVKNKDQLDFTGRQNRELDKTRNWFPSLNDLWLFLGAGMDNVVEE